MENVFDYPYYRIMRGCLQCMGHWPFQSSRKKLSIRCLMILIIFSILIPKIIKLIESLDNFDIVSECLPLICCHGLGLIKFFNWIIMEDYMKRLLLNIEKDWKSLRGKPYADVLHQHSERARQLNIIYASFPYATLAVYFCSPAAPIILDYLLPLNESRPKIFLFQTEYFVDPNKYYFFILLHAYITAPIILGCIILFDNLFAIFISHACGMVAILNLHLQSIHYSKAMDANYSIEDINFIKRHIIMCSNLQTQIFKFIHDLESSYDVALLFIVGINMLLILFSGIVVLMKLSNPNDMIRLAGINVSSIIHLFWISWLGHMLITQTEHIWYSIYQCEWYRLPCQLQLMLVSLMVRNVKPCQLTAGKVYIMSMSGFGAALRTVMSLFTVLNSMR